VIGVAEREPKRKELLRRWSSLHNERSSWITHYRDLADNLLPRSGRFYTSDRNRGDKRHNNIYDSTGTRSVRILGAGMMAGMTSPARPWVRLATTDDDLMEFEPVRLWLDDTTKTMLAIFAKSNTYATLHNIYEELGVFGTAATVVDDNYDSVLWHNALTAGEYAIATDDLGNVCTLFREFDYTVSQLVKRFGLENVSMNVRHQYEMGKSLDSWVTVVHAIEPRFDRNPKMRDSKNKPWASCYFEKAGDEYDKLLREAGYDEFPVLAPRWHRAGGDIYGNSPGMDALGDVKQLQHQQRRKAEGIDYMTRPPVAITGEYKSQESSMLPGGAMYISGAGPNVGVKQAFDVNLRLDHLLQDIQDVRERIGKTFYADLFLMLSNQDRGQPITAREVAERHEEKLLMLGPTLERLHNEMLTPLIDMTFAKMVRAGIVLSPPREMQGMELKVEFVSTLAQAQRAVGLGSIDRLIGTVAAIAQAKPEVLDKLDGDQIVDKYADALGVDPSLIVADDKVAFIREGRAKQQAAMAQAQMVAAGAETAKTLSETDTTGKSGLSDVMGFFTGYGAPQGA